MDKFEHLILTRFNLPINNWEEDKNGNPIRTDDWLEHRFDLFDRYCFPSVRNQSNQNFKWLVFFSDKTPEKYRRRIASYEEFDNFTPIFLDSSMGFDESFRNKCISDHLECDTQYLITTRLDNDDALGDNAVAVIQSRFHEQEFEVLNFRDVYYLCDDQLCVWESECNQFVSIIERIEDGQFKTAWFKQNSLIPDTHPVTQITGGPYCLVLVHDRNIFNEQRGESCPLERLEEDFTLSGDAYLELSLLIP